MRKKWKALETQIFDGILYVINLKAKTISLSVHKAHFDFAAFRKRLRLFKSRFYFSHAFSAV